MSSLSDAEINSIIPKSGPSIEQVKKYLEKYNDEYIVIKCGGSVLTNPCLLYTSPSPRDGLLSRMPSSA